MIPIAIFVIIWLILIAIFMVVSLLSVMQMMRFGVRGPETKWAVILFIGMAICIIVGTLFFLSQIDLKSGLDAKPIFESLFPN
jgi:hypothetical protein